MHLWFRTLQIPFYIHNTAHDSCIKLTILSRGCCQAISNKSKWQIRVFSLRFPNISYVLPLMYEISHIPLDFYHNHYDGIKWKHFPRYWPFVQGIHWSPVNSLTKASDAELWCFLWSAPWINGWVNNPEAGDLRRHHASRSLWRHCNDSSGGVKFMLTSTALNAAFVIQIDMRHSNITIDWRPLAIQNDIPYCRHMNTQNISI